MSAETTTQAQTAGEISISGANAHETYTGYKIFDVSFSENSDTSKNYSYTIDKDSPVYSIVAAYKYLNEQVFTFTENTANSNIYEVTINELFTGEEAAKDFAKYLSEKLPVIEIPEEVTGNVIADKENNKYQIPNTNYEVQDNISEKITDEQQTIYWENLSYGYWFVTTTAGTLCNLNTTAPEAHIADKNPDASIDKKVQEDSDGSWKDDFNTAEVGDTVEYITIVKTQPGAINYKLYDSMTEGLSLNKESIVIFVDTNKNGVQDEEETTVASTGNYTVAYDQTIKREESDVHCDFVITFENDYLATITEETWLGVTYDAVLNEKAKIKASGSSRDYELNDTVLTYGNDSRTEWDQTKTYSLFFDLIKVDTSGKVLQGAQFELYRDVNCTDKVLLIDTGSQMYRVATDEQETQEGFQSAIIVAGHADVGGLDANTTYYLKEVQAPAGYNMVDGVIKVEIGDNSLNSSFDPEKGTTWTEDMSGIAVVNMTGTELPSTGGMGTSIFYAAGSILVIAAVVVLITRKRMSAES